MRIEELDDEEFFMRKVDKEKEELTSIKKLFLGGFLGGNMYAFFCEICKNIGQKIPWIYLDSW